MIGPRMPAGYIRRTRAEVEAIAASSTQENRERWLGQLLDKATRRGHCLVYGGERDRARKAGQYGVTTFYGFQLNTHRLSLILRSGAEVGDLDVRHECDTPGCINPEHLVVGTRQDNMWDAVKRGRIAGVPPDRIIARRAGGETLASIGRSFGVTREGIRMLVKRHGARLAAA